MTKFRWPEVSHLEKWANRSAYELFLFSSRFGYPMASNDFLHYLEEGQGSIDSYLFHDLDSPVGYCEFKAISHHHQHATIAHVLISPDKRGLGYSRQMLQLMVEQGFQTLGLHRIGLSVHTNNEVAIRAYKSVGFKIEGEIREVLRFDNKFYSLYQMALLNPSHF